MRVIVVGAGEVGTHVAQLLSREGSDVTVIESRGSRIAQIDKLLDVTIVHGSATDPVIMQTAGVSGVDLLVAATSTDSVNLVASLIAKLEGAKRCVVRLEQPSIRSESAVELHRAVGADLVIDPDESVAREILDLLTYPGAVEIARLADNEVLMVGATLAADAPFTGRTLSEIGEQYEPEWDFIFCTITREGTTVVPTQGLPARGRRQRAGRHQDPSPRTRVATTRAHHRRASSHDDPGRRPHRRDPGTPARREGPRGHDHRS